MSAATTSSKSTTATAILYKKSKDVPHLPLVEKWNPRRTLTGFKAVPKFTARQDLTKNDEWEGYEQAECNALIKGMRPRWRVSGGEEEEKKKKSKPAAPIASGFRKGKAKGKTVEEVVDSESKADTEF
ncbi:hypothetical protein M422DRAFT_253419 [Sphaerobolus stellatus SS14]|uniref:Uncharacterized protein n=1 Tax=Sphaerobolus stellatus (strain SS14) TaxID=990650 RepID=A0A0C9VMU3_SPHS4|nr:hypothetical protein M422DRAFT_253419 [Sphaerobolus stellatus SS14]